MLEGYACHSEGVNSHVHTREVSAYPQQWVAAFWCYASIIIRRAWRVGSRAQAFNHNKHRASFLNSFIDDGP